MNIFLLGYMGSGKSFFSKKLSKVTSLDLIDLDYLIEKKEKKSISDIFLNNGEDYFRKIENIVLNNVVRNNKKIIISTGGGTPCFFRNIELMNDFGITIYLKKDPNKLYNLLVKSKKGRPVFESFKNKDEFFNNFKHREQFYLKSKIIIDCDSISNKEIILKINHILNENRFEK